jgi:hypothetical protein
MLDSFADLLDLVDYSSELSRDIFARYMAANGHVHTYFQLQATYSTGAVLNPSKWDVSDFWDSDSEMAMVDDSRDDK